MFIQLKNDIGNQKLKMEELFCDFEHGYADYPNA
jgi:hypothetical protein